MGPCPQGKTSVPPGGGTDTVDVPKHIVFRAVAKAKSVIASVKSGVDAIKSKLDSATNVPVLKQIKSVVGVAKGAMDKVQAKLSERYGAGPAKVIFWGGQAIGANPLVVPPWFVAIPGSTFLASLPLAVGAEVVLQASRGIKAGKSALGFAEMPALPSGQEYLDEVYLEFFAALEPMKDELAKVLAPLAGLGHDFCGGTGGKPGPCPSGDSGQVSKGVSALKDNPKKALAVLNSEVTWSDKNDASKAAMVDALSQAPASRLKREWAEHETSLITAQQSSRSNPTPENTEAVAEWTTKLDLIEGALAKGHGLEIDENGKWKPKSVGMCGGKGGTMGPCPSGGSMPSAEDIANASKDVSPKRIEPPDPAMNSDRVASMAAQMEKSGEWIGRPVIVTDHPTGENDKSFQAWTGSHRLAAAQEAHVDAKVVVVDSADLQDALEKSGHDRDTHPTDLSDDDKLEVFGHLENKIPLELIRQEIDLYGTSTLSEPSSAANSEIAKAGADTAKAKQLLSAAETQAAARVAKLCRSALERHGAGIVKAKAFFSDEERQSLADLIAATNGTAELLGRSRIREKQSAVERGKKFAEVPFHTFDETAFGPMSPARALEYFRRLVPTLSVGAAWEAGISDAAFRIAGITEITILERIKEVIDGVLSTGTSVEDAIKDVDGLLDEAGLTERNPVRAEAIVRTEMMTSYNTGAEEEGLEVADTFPVYEYLNPDDGRSRPTHAARNGKYFANTRATRFSVVRGEDAGDVIQCRCTPRLVDKFEWAELQAAGAVITHTFAEMEGKLLWADRSPETPTCSHEQVEPVEPKSPQIIKVFSEPVKPDPSLSVLTDLVKAVKDLAEKPAPQPSAPDQSLADLIRAMVEDSKKVGWVVRDKDGLIVNWGKNATGTPE